MTSLSKARPTPEWLRQVWKHRHFYLFISPFLILFAVFGLYPLLFSLGLSFMKWDGLSQATWVGLGNFSRMLDDDILRTSLWNTIVIGLLYIPPMMILALLFALALNTGWLKARAFFRAAFFLPCVTPMVVISIVFGLLYSSERGLLNYLILRMNDILPFLHMKAVPWLTSEEWSKISISILVVWRWTGYNMVLMLAGLQGISQEYYEAAEVDGANGLQRLWYITVPLMRPVFLFCGILSLLGTIYMFDEIFVLTAGGPGTSSINLGLYLFNTSFVDFRFGYASCVAYTVGIVAFAVSLLILNFNRAGQE